MRNKTYYKRKIINEEYSYVATMGAGLNGIKSERVRERLLRERGLTLDKALDVCQINEQSEEQLKVLNDVQSVKAI
jgi:hypothetical protein